MKPARRALIALPDAAMAGLYLWCWIAPLALNQNLVAFLALALLIEFVVIQAGPFLGKVVYGEAMGLDRGQRVKTAVVLGAVYLSFAGLAAASFESWYPFVAFVWLFGVKVFAAVLGSDRAATGRERETTIMLLSIAYFFVANFAAIYLPFPKLGITEDGAAYGLYGQDEWSNFPYEAIAAGFLYFSALALTRLLRMRGSLGLSRSDAPGGSSGTEST
jgi:hypothetical protein